MDTKSLLDCHSFNKLSPAEQRAEFRPADFDKAVSIKTLKGSLQYDPAKRGEVTIGDRTFTIEHCLFNYTINECKIGEGAVFIYTRQTLSQAICLNRTVCTITTNALLAREGSRTEFYFDLRHAEELTEKAINQMKKCAAEAHGEEGQIILCREVTPVLRMMANGLDVPILLSVPVLRNEKETAKQFYKALKNNAHEVEASSPLSTIMPALLQSLHAEKLLISKLDSTGPGLWKVECTVYVTCLAALLTGPQMTLQTEQALHVSLSNGGVDALTIVEVVRVLKSNSFVAGGNTKDASAIADHNSADAENLDINNDSDYHPADEHTEHPTSVPSSPSSCHSDLSLLASTIPDLTAVQALTHLTVPWEAAQSGQEKVLSHTELLEYSQRALDSLQQLRKSLNSAPSTTSTTASTTAAAVAAPVAAEDSSRSAALPVSSGADSRQSHTISAPAPLRKPLSNGASVPSHKQPSTQPSPTQIHPLINSLPVAPPLSTSSSADPAPKAGLPLPIWMQELQKSRRNPTPVFTTSSSSTPAPHFVPSQPAQEPLKRKDWSLSSDSDSVRQESAAKRVRGSDPNRCDTTTSALLDPSPKNQRATIRATKWVKLTMETAHTTNDHATGPAQPQSTATSVPCTDTTTSTNTRVTQLCTETIKEGSTQHPTGSELLSSLSALPHLINGEPEKTFLLPKRRTTVPRMPSDPQHNPEQQVLQQSQQQQQQQQQQGSEGDATCAVNTPTTVVFSTSNTATTALSTNLTDTHCATTTTTTSDSEVIITKTVTEISDTEESTASHSSTATDTLSLLQPQPQPLSLPHSTLLPTSVRHTTTGITMYASTATDYERLGDFLEYALTEKVQQELRSLSVPVAVYRGSSPPALSPEVVCVELNQRTLPAATFGDLVLAQAALRSEVTIKVEE